MTAPTFRFALDPTVPGARFPVRATPSASGFDLIAPSGGILMPGARVLIATGVIVAAPMGWEAQVRPRSGLAVKFGVTTLPSLGTIDSDYRGSVGVGLVNLGTEPWTWAAGDRIAQLVFAPVWHGAIACAEDVAELGATERGAGGFGSTGRGAAR